MAVVELTVGRVRGRDGAWLGIPYAAPPLGERRWRAPAPVAPWAGELDALAPGPPPPQPLRPISEFAWGAIPPGDEDCLYLNVWTPRTGDGPWPVLVWSIGGGWAIGWTGSGLDDGALLAERAQAVVVTFSYRLGSLGWAYGNWGLLDHVAVLEWVRREIRAFGGDPGRVTMGGQSAGAGNVAALLVSPPAEGLFAQALLHSPPLPETAGSPARRERWERDLAVTRDTPAAAVVQAHEALLQREGEWRGTRGAALPTLEAATIPVAPLDAPDARLSVPVLVGTTRDEATFLLRTGGREASDEQVERLTDELFAGPTRAWAAARLAAGGRVHRFRIEHASPRPELGALHTIDVPLLFGTFATSQVARHYVADDERTRAVSAVVQREWGRFLHGEPPTWPADEVHVIGGGV
ncbi:MAG TPA: carboxylesterase family protein [Solirubrobacteraceae bacterium]|nr:carboxylesterase family protein [Solirubrobacteraceae bacterium]